MTEHTVTMTPEAKEALTESVNKKKSAGAQARYAAIKTLIENHQDEFNALYVAEATARGVRTRSSSRAAKIAKLEADLAELRGA
jgi:hypothetical protein